MKPPEEILRDLVRRWTVSAQVDFPKTHALGQLLDLVCTIDPVLAESLRDATILNPHGDPLPLQGDLRGRPAVAVVGRGALLEFPVNLTRLMTDAVLDCGIPPRPDMNPLGIRVTDPRRPGWVEVPDRVKPKTCRLIPVQLTICLIVQVGVLTRVVVARGDIGVQRTRTTVQDDEAVVDVVTRLRVPKVATLLKNEIAPVACRIGAADHAVLQW
ncbi:MAG: hypothetical protein HY775_08720 [Acidobacteria bacterium]|nr:hypothetical protein [Acidobacteriota bacterium]